MAVRCYLEIGSLTVYPELPVRRDRVIVARDEVMLNGQLRRAYRAARWRFTLTLGDMDEATYGAWVTAATPGAAVTYTDETGVAWNCLVTDVTSALTRTAPAVEGGLSTTGPGYYEITVVIEQAS